MESQGRLACVGVGMMLGVGRAGAILAPIVIGVIVGMNLPLEQNFMAISIPAAIAAVTIMLVQHGRSDLVRHHGAVGAAAPTVVAPVRRAASMAHK